VYSRGEFLIRPTSVVALDGERNRVSSSSGSSVAARRVLRNRDVLRPAEGFVGVPTSDGV